MIGWAFERLTAKNVVDRRGRVAIGLVSGGVVVGSEVDCTAYMSAFG